MSVTGWASRGVEGDGVSSGAMNPLPQEGGEMLWSDEGGMVRSSLGQNVFSLGQDPDVG